MGFIFNIADMVEKNGKTVRQNNRERQHTLPIGTLVEFVQEAGADEDEDYTGVRLYVVCHTRDCDEEPLVVLAANKHEESDFMQIGPFCESSLRPVDT
jgi:hypothetical protein